MRHEVLSAVNFLTNLLQKGSIDLVLVETFKQALFKFLCLHYTNHWFPDKPNKGSAYRCMRIVNKKIDPLILRAAVHCGLTEQQLRLLLPSELTIWVDPNEVSYRIGEEGSIGVLFEESDRKSASPDVLQRYPELPFARPAVYFANQGLDAVECMAS